MLNQSQMDVILLRIKRELEFAASCIVRMHEKTTSGDNQEAAAFANEAYETLVGVAGNLRKVKLSIELLESAHEACVQEPAAEV